ncbi:hypothetical protein ACRJ4B_39765 [Streptomyces sp. GTA36]|uniref:hypothetical protein n=1 Tax=Streptomyces sp. 2-1 TaxID=412710 RepID=UPI003AFB7B3E
MRSASLIRQWKTTSPRASRADVHGWRRTTRHTDPRGGRTRLDLPGEPAEHATHEPYFIAAERGDDGP